MRFKITLFLLLFAALSASAQTYTPVDGKVYITITQTTSDGGSITTQTAPIDSSEAASRFLNSLVATNQRIAEIRTELEEMERQAKRTAEAYEALKGESTDIRVAGIFATQIVGTYEFADDKGTSECQIREQDGAYFLGTEFGQFPLKIRSATLFEVSDIYDEKHPLKFTLRQAGTFIYDDRDRKIVLTKIEAKGERKESGIQVVGKPPTPDNVKVAKKDMEGHLIQNMPLDITQKTKAKTPKKKG